jgi:hypothetical protein
VVDGEDVVPRLPWLLWAYRHAGVEVLYVSGGSRFGIGTPCLVDAPWWRRLWWDVRGVFVEWRAAGRIGLLRDHSAQAYLKVLAAEAGGNAEGNCELQIENCKFAIEEAVPAGTAGVKVLAAENERPNGELAAAAGRCDEYGI